MENHSAKNWREAISRALGQYTDPVPSKSVRDITQRLDRLEANLSKVAGEVEWIAVYLRKRAEQQGGPRVQAQGSQVVPPVPGNDSRTD
ncbi:hypothetical protein CBQ26_00460 [Deinococcus indicus]|uniref:Uncharacterized protein n=2 Tax=Deinococcus indicus TaxID=223556 RepID=A0A246BTF7_9DEIO|nr:hypothetical protein CBQ26_00460 [Deinococcus indicus]